MTFKEILVAYLKQNGYDVVASEKKALFLVGVHRDEKGKIEVEVTNGPLSGIDLAKLCQLTLKLMSEDYWHYISIGNHRDGVWVQKHLGRLL